MEVGRQPGHVRPLKPEMGLCGAQLLNHRACRLPGPFGGKVYLREIGGEFVIIIEKYIVLSQNS